MVDMLCKTMQTENWQCDVGTQLTISARDTSTQTVATATDMETQTMRCVSPVAQVSADQLVVSPQESVDGSCACSPFRAVSQNGVMDLAGQIAPVHAAAVLVASPETERVDKAIDDPMDVAHVSGAVRATEEITKAATDEPVISELLLHENAQDAISQATNTAEVEVKIEVKVEVEVKESQVDVKQELVHQYGYSTDVLYAAQWQDTHAADVTFWMNDTAFTITCGHPFLVWYDEPVSKFLAESLPSRS
ncbi:hypothetical protein BC831DRAFT_466492 [Entophlyctis helioformis]|nr:hypothetical protein BC831DRAFT_466492 [Entophlyctis helioformis]